MRGLFGPLVRTMAEESLALTLVVLLGWVAFAAGGTAEAVHLSVENTPTMEVHRF